MPELDDEDLNNLEKEWEPGYDLTKGWNSGGAEASRAGDAKIRVPPLNKGKRLKGPAKRVKLDSPEAIQKAVGRVLKTVFTSTNGCSDLQSASVFIRGSETLLKDYRRAQELELVTKVEELEERLKLVVGMGKS